MKELTLPAAVESIPQITEWVNTELQRLDCPAKAKIHIDIAIDEIVSNIAHYAYGAAAGRLTVQAEVQHQPPAITLMFIDSGTPFNPLEFAEPDISVPLQERGVGGLGIFLVKKTMDAVTYRYADGQNRLTIQKSWKGDGTTI